MDVAAAGGGGASGGDKFPIGMRVLVVDDDPLCLMILKKMLQQCQYNVTTCSRAIEALQMLRERKFKFDLVMSDVYMPDIDGFKLLELIGLEMDLPVIMMSANGETSVVMKGITHGACDYLLKPVRLEELRNIWQHVVRKRGGSNSRGEVKEESSGEWDESDKPPDGASELSSKKRKEKFEEEQIDSISGLKKPRVVWSGELHRLFVRAVNQLGVDKAVPKKILEIMNVQGLSRENVASHLQKYRLGLKRLSGVDLEPHPIASFQADESGNLGGSMSIQPAGSRTSSSKSGSSSGVFGKGLNQLDPGTLAALQQLQALQHSKVLKSPRALKMRQTAMEQQQQQQMSTNSGLLNRTCSFDLGSLHVENQWAAGSWQQRPTPAVKQELNNLVQPPGGGGGGGVGKDDFETLSCFKDVRLEDPPAPAPAAAQAFGLAHDLLLPGDDLYFAAAPTTPSYLPAFPTDNLEQHQQQQLQHRDDWY